MLPTDTIAVVVAPDAGCTSPHLAGCAARLPDPPGAP
jgi:hypothetical protein